MRTMVLLSATAAFAALASCDAVTEQADIATRLKQGDTSVCADRDVQETFAKVVAGGDKTYEKFLASGEKLPPLKVVNATGVNKDIGEVSCSGNFTVNAPFFGPVDARVDFKVRPALDEGGGFIVEARKDEPGNSVVASWFQIGALKQISEEANSAAQEPPQELPQEAAPEPQTSGSAYYDDNAAEMCANGATSCPYPEEDENPDIEMNATPEE